MLSIYHPLKLCRMKAVSMPGFTFISRPKQRKADRLLAWLWLLVTLIKQRHHALERGLKWTEMTFRGNEKCVGWCVLCRLVTWFTHIFQNMCVNRMSLCALRTSRLHKTVQDCCVFTQKWKNILFWLKFLGFLLQIKHKERTYFIVKIQIVTQ